MVIAHESGSLSVRAILFGLRHCIVASCTKEGGATDSADICHGKSKNSKTPDRRRRPSAVTIAPLKQAKGHVDVECPAP